MAQQERDIKYVNKEFGDFRQGLIELAKNYFPDAYNDFSPTSPGMMFIEMASYLGDVLSFYQDTQLQETFLQHAKNPSNLYSLAYMMGYRPKVSAVSSTVLTVTQRVAAQGSTYTPNFNQALKITEGATVTSTISGSTTFTTSEPIDFSFSSSYDPTDVTIFSLDGGQPAEFLLSKKVLVTSGAPRVTTSTFTTAEKFATIELGDTNIVKVQSIVDSDGNEWKEVPFLGQDTVFQEVTNSATDSNLVPSTLNLVKAPRRFVTRFTSKGVLQIQFGSGITGTDNDSFLPNPNEQITGTKQDVNKLDYAYDPSNFLFTGAYGISPTNTTLIITYIVGGGVASNAPANSITALGTVATSAIDDSYTSTLAFNNVEAATGGGDGDSIDELRQNSLRSFAEQQRMVTENDFTVRALSMPTQFGSVAKVYVSKGLATLNSEQQNSDVNSLALSMYTLGYDINKKLVSTSSSLKANLKKYLSQYIMLTDAINLKDAFIVNIKVKFEIVALPNVSSRDVLLSCTEELKEYFSISKWNINQPINLSSIYTLLDKVKGVQTVKTVEVDNLTGGKYSTYAYDVKGATRNNIVYPSYDPCIFEIKYPNSDIEGRVTTL